MYPVRLGFAAAIKRVRGLQANGHDAEALLTAVFTVEKTLRRTLRQLIVSAGFPSRIALKIIANVRGLDAIHSSWEFYDPRHRRLTEIIALADWNVFKKASEMRNALVHGNKVFGLQICKTQTNEVLASLATAKAALDSEYGYSGWAIAKARRTSRLHSDPKVTWTK